MASESSKRRKQKPRELGPAARADRVLRDLKALTMYMAQRYGHDPVDPLPIEALAIEINIATGDYKKIRAASTTLLDTLNAQLEAALKGRMLFRPGRVFCFQCEEPACEHSAPPASVDTFAGYTAMGKPTWKSFLNLCLEAGDERVDRLYEDKPEPIARIVLAEDLRGELLPSFGRESRVFSLLGQVVVGWVAPSPSQIPTAENRRALTFQILETRSGEVQNRLRLNIIGTDWDEIVENAVAGPVNAPAEKLRQLLVQTSEELLKTERRLSGAEEDGVLAVAPLLKRLARDAEQVLKTSSHRTKHANARQSDDGRPIRAAMRDACEASDERLLWDVRHRTIVVLGPKSRTHIFTEDARHVTSIRLGRGELDRKSRGQRWVTLDKDVKQAFRQRLDRLRTTA